MDKDKGLEAEDQRLFDYKQVAERINASGVVKGTSLLSN